MNSKVAYEILLVEHYLSFYFKSYYILELTHAVVCEYSSRFLKFNGHAYYIFRMRQVIILIILAAIMRYVFMGTRRPSEHDGKDKTIDSLSLFHTSLNVTRNVTLRTYFTKKFKLRTL